MPDTLRDHFMNNHAPSLLYTQFMTFIQRNTLIPSTLKNFSETDLLKIKELKQAIEQGKDASIFKDNQCLAYLLYLLKTNQIEDEKAGTIFTYIMAIQSGYQTEIMDLGDEHNQDLKNKFINSMIEKMEDTSTEVNKDLLKQEIEKLKGVNAWIIKARKLGESFGEDEEFLNTFFHSVPFFKEEKQEDPPSNYLISSMAISHLVLKKTNKFYIRMYIIAGIISLYTLKNMHTLGFHPLQTHGGHLVKNNLEKAHDRKLSPLAIYLHDFYHTYSGSLLSKKEHHYLFTKVIPQLDILITMIENTMPSDTDTPFIKILKNIAYFLNDMDIALFKRSHTRYYKKNELPILSFSEDILTIEKIVKENPLFFDAWIARGISKENIFQKNDSLLTANTIELQQMVLFYYFLYTFASPEIIKHLSPIVPQLKKAMENFVSNKEFSLPPLYQLLPTSPEKDLAEIDQSILHLYFDLHASRGMKISPHLKNRLIEYGLNEDAQQERALLIKAWGEFLDNFSNRSPDEALDELQNFIKQGVNLSLPNQKGHSILYLAVHAKNEKVITQLLQAGLLSKEINRKFDKTFLIEVAINHKAWNIVKQLALHGAIIAQEMVAHTIKENQWDIAVCYIYLGVKCNDIMSKDLYKLTMGLAENKAWNDVFYIIQQEKNLTMDILDDLLYCALKQNQWTVIINLVKTAKSIHYYLKNVELVLMTAIQKNKLDIINFLFGKMKNKNDYFNLDILNVIIEKNDLQILRYFLSINLNLTNDTICLILEKASLELVDVLLSHQDRFPKNFSLNSCLHQAAHRGRLDLIKFLLNKGIPLDCRDQNENTPLILSAFNKQWQAVQFFIEAGAYYIDEHYKEKINFIKKSSTSFMKLVIAEKQWDLLWSLIKKGTSLRWKDSQFLENQLTINDHAKLYQFIHRQRLPSFELIRNTMRGITCYQTSKKDNKSYDTRGDRRAEIYLMILQSPSLSKFIKEVAIYALLGAYDGSHLQESVLISCGNSFFDNKSCSTALPFFKARITQKAAKKGIYITVVDDVVKDIVKYANSNQKSDETLIDHIVRPIK